MTRPDWVPPDVNVEQPSVARIYDYNLGGSHNFAIDREVADRINAVMPELPAVSRANRAFLRRAVRHLTDLGIRQFLDLGSGIPSVGNVHEIATGARVVYSDADPIAVAHGRAILARVDRATAIQADLRDPGYILTHPEVTNLLDFNQPVAVLMLAVLHFIPDADDPLAVVARYRDAMAVGSHLVISHATADGSTTAHADAATTEGARHKINVTTRTRAQVSRMFDGLTIIEPGLVFTPQWRPDSGDGTDGEFADDPRRAAALAGVARKD